MRQKVLKVGGFILFCNIGLYFTIQQYVTFGKQNAVFERGWTETYDHIGMVPDSVRVLKAKLKDNSGMLSSHFPRRGHPKNAIFTALNKTVVPLGHGLRINGTSTKPPVLEDADVFTIAAVILVRIYKGDKPKWTTVELEQWVRYMQYAGVCRVYLYDNYKYLNESLGNWTAATFSEFEVTYHDWSKYMPYSISGTQHTAYRHALENYGALSTWQIAYDMDEYPFASVNRAPGFLVQFLKSYGEQNPAVSEFSTKNHLFLGQPTNRTFVIERMLRRTPKPANSLDKPIYKTKCVRRAQVHHNNLSCGKSMDVEPKYMRNNHYWGARMQHWGADTPEVLNKTIPDDSALEIARAIKIMLSVNGSVLSSQCEQFRQRTSNVK